MRGQPQSGRVSHKSGGHVLRKVFLNPTFPNVGGQSTRCGHAAGEGKAKGKAGGGLGGKIQVHVRNFVMTGRVRGIALNCMSSIHESAPVSAFRLEIESG